MKRLIFTFAFTLCVFCAFAQEHLSFKGIPIEGSMDSFCQKLQSKGLTKLGTDGNTSAFIGDFTGRQATIGVQATDDGQNVHSVMVILDSSDDWKNLVGTYDYYKDLYTRKYGKPTATQEDKIQNHGNSYIMSKLYDDEFTYACKWEVTGGIIGLTISKSTSYGEGSVKIVYFDSLNMENKIQNDLNDI